jgi:hypothetical protein
MGDDMITAAVWLLALRWLAVDISGSSDDDDRITQFCDWVAAFLTVALAIVLTIYINR